jgi:rRNA-processing protein FCF1
MAWLLHIVVDTNVLTGARPFGTNAYLRALEATREEHIRLVVPELVIRETANIWARSVADNDRAMTLAHRKLTRAGVEIAELPDAVDVGRLHQSLIAMVREQLEAAGGIVPPLPAVSHDTVVERALDRRQPFDTAGHNGYRDVLLWETVLELVREGHEVLLVSNDRAAFSAARKVEGVLAEVLRDEAQEAAGRRDAVSLAHDLSTALEAVADSDEEVQARFEKLLENEDFIEELHESLSEELDDYGLDGSALTALELPPGLVDGRITDGGWVDYMTEDLAVTHARRGGGSILLLELRVTRLESIELRFANTSVESVMSVMDLVNPELDDEQGLFRGSTTARCVMRADVRVDEEDQSVVDVAVTAVEVTGG